MVEDYFKDVENGYTVVHSQRLVDEIKVFQWSESGKAEALRGYNDDLVIAYSIYTHLKDNVFASRPLGMSTSQTHSTDIKSEMEEVEWSEREEKVKHFTGVDLETYYWLQGKEPPEGFKKYKKREKEFEEDPAAQKVEIVRPPEWLAERMQQIRDREPLAQKDK